MVKVKKIITKIELDLSDEDSELLKFAEWLHDQMCTLNHTDRCGYHYEKWNDINPNRQNDCYSKLESWYRAKRILEFHDWDYNKAYRGLDLYKPLKTREVQEKINEDFLDNES